MEKLIYFDAHTHVQFAAYDMDREEVIRRARAAGVGMVNIGTQYDTSRRAIELAEKHEGLYAAIGLHPIHTSKSFHDADELGGDETTKGFTSRGEVFDKERYRELAMHPKTVAIGECGLDYYRLRPRTDADGTPRRGSGQALTDADEEIKDKQKKAFIAQIELAHEVKKPLMIHCRDAFPDLITTLHASRFKLHDMPGIIHFFTGTKDDAKALLELGFSFTFGGAITFPPRKGKARGDYDEVVEMVPFDHLLSETDAPYVSPAPYRGKRNEPAYVVEVVKKLAELKGVSVEEMRAQIFENAQRMFSLQ